MPSSAATAAGGTLDGVSRALRAACPALVHESDYRATQAVGACLHHEGHPGLLVPSVRHEGGLNAAILNPAVLSNPRFTVALTYRLEGPTITVERAPGRRWLVVDTRAW